MDDLTKLSKIIIDKMHETRKEYLENMDKELLSFDLGLWFVLDQINRLRVEKLDAEAKAKDSLA